MLGSWSVAEPILFYYGQYLLLVAVSLSVGLCLYTMLIRTIRSRADGSRPTAPVADAEKNGDAARKAEADHASMLQNGIRSINAEITKIRQSAKQEDRPLADTEMLRIREFRSLKARMRAQAKRILFDDPHDTDGTTV